MSPLFLEFLMGKRNLHCTAWGMPGYGIFGWQKPCYLLQDGYAEHVPGTARFHRLVEIRLRIGQSQMRQLHVAFRLRSLRGGLHLLVQGIFATIRAMLFSRYRDAEAARQLAAEKPQPALVQIDAIAPRPSITGAQVAAPAQMAKGIEEAFDYRGDVTVTLGTGEKLEGYIFDREQKADLAASTMRIMTKPGQKLTIRYADVSQLSFTGRDMADGRSWEAWVRKYAERKAAGEKNIELLPESLD